MEIKLIVDDITGTEVTESEKIKLAVGDVTGTLDLSPESLAALRALASGDGAGALTALLAPTTVRTSKPRTGGKRSRDSAPDGETLMTAEEMRAWGREHGYVVNERGRVPKEVKAAILTARAGKPALAAVSAAPAAPAQSDAQTGTDATVSASTVKTAKPVAVK